MEAAKENMADAAAVVHDKYEKGVYDSIRDDFSGNPVIGVSYDGTWQKRDHSSHYVVGAVCEINSGLVLDTHTASNLCPDCNTNPDEGEEWFLKHEPVCKRNFDGSSNAMEVEAAEVFLFFAGM